MIQIRAGHDLPWRKVICRYCDAFYGWMKECRGFNCRECDKWNAKPL